ncbi:MAG: DUF2079 domain-containing protein [Myxococcales bacterium]|nr:DUF2079 domain-containing protein [Myxococcales bacterium]
MSSDREAPTGSPRPSAIARALQGWDTSVSRLASTAVALVGWPLAYGFALGLGLWAWRDAAIVTALAGNKTSDPDKLVALRWVAVATAALVAVYGGAALFERLRHGRFNLLRVAGALNRLLFVTLAVPFVAALRQPAIERTDTVWTAVLASAATLIVGVGVYRFARWPAQELLPRYRRLAAVGAVALVLLLWFAYGYLLSDLALTNHRALNTRTTDLGYYDNIFYQSIHGRPLGCTFIKGENHMSAHFDPILVLLSPLYLLWPKADFLLVLQSVWLGAGVVPIYLLARLKLGGHLPGFVLALVYALYPALHGANLYEFHSLSLAAPLILWALYFFERGSYLGYAVFFLLLLACREDVPLLLAFVGLYGIFSQDRRKTRLGWATLVLSVAYFVVVKKYVMASSDLFNTGKAEAYSFSYYFKDLIPRADQGGTAFIVTLLTNPVYALKLALANDKKILFLFLMFLPLAALPFVARRARIMLIYGLLFCLLASREAVFTIHFQYSTMLFGVAFAATPVALRQLRDDARLAALGIHKQALERALLAAMLAAGLLVSWKFGALVPNDNFRAGFMGLTRTLSDKHVETWEWVQEMVAKIPPGAVVMTTNRLGAHVSNRRGVYFYREGTPHHYVFVDEAELKGTIRTWHDKRTKSGELVELGRQKTMALFQVVEGAAEEVAEPGTEFVPESPEEPDKDPTPTPKVPPARPKR